MQENIFRIQLDEPVPVYFPGQNVSGHVYVLLRQKESCRSVSVKCLGQSEVHWMESTTAGRDRDNNYYNSTETYFSHKANLYGPGSNECELEVGEYRFPFQFTLPSQLPSSFEGTYGSVRYLVKAKMDRPFAFDYTCQVPFTVNSIVDLNTNPKASVPLRSEDSTHLCCWCCRSGPITARVWLDQAGYVPGETIQFCAEVDNKSGKDLSSSKLRLVEKIEYRAQGFVKTEERTVQEFSRGCLKDKDSEIWDHVPVILPALPPSGLPGCNIIDTTYTIEFVVDPGSFSFNLVVPLELMIGTIPLRKNFNNFVSSPVPAGQNPLGAGGFLPPFAIEQYPNIPPVYYEESKFGGDIQEDVEGRDQDAEGILTRFAPFYLMYCSQKF